ncbi:hypothetical protein [Roseomonas sp. BN140053]|uniref:hypothetical protein n=1 Tax=Roseomonas sp. BN140053 TaxID=3391898 RepID=UPI0039E97C4D
MISQPIPLVLHKAELIAQTARLGGPSYRYRGSTLDATDAADPQLVKWFLKSPGHPCDGHAFASQEECRRTVNYWLDQD